MGGGREAIGWLPECSVDAVRTALRRMRPELADRSIVLNPLVPQGDPRWSSSSAVVDGGVGDSPADNLVVKFAWSPEAAAPLWHEALVLPVLAAGADAALCLPDVVATARHPVLLATRLVRGRPLTYEMVGAGGPSAREQIAGELASYLARLHRTDLLDRVESALGPLGSPTPQATTEALRAHFGPYIRVDQRDRVWRWCDWVDAVLSSTGDAVFVHGDLHGHNQVWDGDDLRLRLVVDYEASGRAEPEYDFRYLPAQGPGVDLMVATASRYEAQTGRPLAIDRIMAWHIRTALGDALWRSQAGVALPGGGSPAQWVDELAPRLDILGLPS
jgi:thiamine kinase-like enzyme